MIAILSDVHSNLIALEAVRADMKALGFSTALCLGDTVGYGPDPAACCDIVEDLCVVSVLGNHEAMVLAVESLAEEGFRADVVQPLRLAAEQLGEDGLARMRSLPGAVDLDAFEIVHASLHDFAEFHYITSPDEAALNFAAQRRPVSFHGHTHLPAVWERSSSGEIRCYQPAEDSPTRLAPKCTYAINPGSVGQPRDGDPRASYMAYDHTSRVLLHRRVPYDLEKAARRFRSAKLPTTSISRLKKGR